MFSLKYQEKLKIFESKNEAIQYALKKEIEEWELLEKIVVSKHTILHIPILYKVKVF